MLSAAEPFHHSAQRDVLLARKLRGVDLLDRVRDAFCLFGGKALLLQLSDELVGIANDEAVLLRHDVREVKVSLLQWMVGIQIGYGALIIAAVTML